MEYQHPQKYESDVEWYCRHDPEEERFYNIFFDLCRKYNIRWASADEKEREFIEEVARVTYERDKAIRLGLPPSGFRPSFVRWLLFDYYFQKT